MHKVLHPRHKLNYFRNAGWDDVWIQTARQIVRDKYQQSYKAQSEDLLDKKASNDESDEVPVSIAQHAASFTTFFTDYFILYGIEETIEKEVEHI